MPPARSAARRRRDAEAALAKGDVAAFAQLQGSSDATLLGSQVAGGDLNDDGYVDVIGSSYIAKNPNGDKSGGVWLWLGTGL